MGRKSLYDEVAELLAEGRKAPLPDITSEIGSGASVAEAIKAFVLRESNAMDAVVLRLAREIDSLRDA